MNQSQKILLGIVYVIIIYIYIKTYLYLDQLNSCDCFNKSNKYSSNIEFMKFFQVLEIFIMLKAIDNKISQLLIKIKKQYNNQDNEIIFIHNIILNFKNTFDFNIFKIKKLSDFSNYNYAYTYNFFIRTST